MLLAEFHDLGKVLIPDEILFKPGPLTHYEWEEMKTHCDKGAMIASSIAELAHLSIYIRSHHERWDGTGYPQGLSGQGIPLFCRMLSIVDSFDAMTNFRPYHYPVSKDVALAELHKNAGRQFDPELVELFVETFFALNKQKIAVELW